MSASYKSSASSKSEEKSHNYPPKDENIEKLFRQTRSIEINEDVIENACNIVGSAWDKHFSEKVGTWFISGR